MNYRKIVNNPSETRGVTDRCSFAPGWFGYFHHSHRSTFPRVDCYVRSRRRAILRKRAGRRLIASRPEIQRRAASLAFSASFFSSPLSVASSAPGGFFAIAVVGLGVEQDDVFEALAIGRDALEHLARGFERGRRFMASRYATKARVDFWRRRAPTEITVGN
jgi:hypothetical protein